MTAALLPMSMLPSIDQLLSEEEFWERNPGELDGDPDDEDHSLSLRRIGLSKARRRYQIIEPVLATRFRKAVKTGFRWICEFPEASPLCDDRHRYCILKGFPYGLVYR